MNEKNDKKLPDIQRTLIMEAPIEKVWMAVATSEGLAAWLMQNTFVPELGYEFTMKAKPMGDWDGTVHCKVMELNPPKRIGFTWCGNNAEHYVSFELEEIDKNKTRFTLVHAGWSAGHEKLREIMYDGWGYLTEDLRKKMGEENEQFIN